MRASSSATTASNAARVAGLDRVGDRPVPPRPARLQFLVDQVAHGDHLRRRRRLATIASARRRPATSPARRAAATAPRCTRAAGRVPADDARRPVRAVHSAAASCERAELWLHRNNISPRGGRPVSAEPGRRGSRTRRTYLRRPSPADADRAIRPACSSTSRWWASRFDGIANRSPSSFGDRSLRRQLVDDRQPGRLAQRRVHRGARQQTGVTLPERTHAVTARIDARSASTRSRISSSRRAHLLATSMSLIIH